MTLQPIIVEQFPGLNLVVDPGELGSAGALDLLNVDFDHLGRVRSRNGFVNFTAAEATNPYDSLFAFHRVATADTIIAGNGPRLESIIAGATSATTTSQTWPHQFTAYGTATENRVYIANGVDTVRYYTHDQFMTPTFTGTTPTGKYVAVQQPDNRLVVARTATNPSRVLFSDPGDPHSFAANNYVDLTPGDGEEIRGLVSWREYVFAFKETKFFAFYGNETDPDSGDPIFNNRSFPGFGIRLGQSCTAAADGVYFLDRRGVYKTVGGNPQPVSGPVEPLFAPFSDPATQQLAALSYPTLTWADDRLYLCYATVGSTTNNRVLVYSTTDAWWSLWDIAASSITAARTSGTDALRQSLMFGRASGPKKIGQITDTITDDSAQIDSYYQTGFMDFGDATQKVILNTLVDGNGQFDLSAASNFASSVRPTRVTLGSSAVTQARSRTSYRGRNFSFRIDSVSGSSWQLNRLVANLRSKSPSAIGE